MQPRRKVEPDQQMSDSLRTAGGGRGWRLLARTLVVAGAAAAGSSVGWFAGNAGADPVLVDLPAASGGAHESTSDRVADLVPDPAAEPEHRIAAPEHRTDPPERADDLPRPVRQVGTVVHHIAEPLARAAEPASEPDAAPRPDESEVDAPDPAADPGRFSLDDLAPQHLVGSVAEAEPVSTALHGAGSLLRPVRGALVPEPGADRPAPLEGLTRPVADGLGKLTAPLWHGVSPGAPAPPAPPAPLPAPGPAPAEPRLPDPPAPATGALPAPANPAAGPATGSAVFTAPGTSEVAAAPAAPGHRAPWSPGKAVTTPPATGTAGHTSDGSGGNGGVGMTRPLPAAAAGLTALRSAGRAADSALNGTSAPSPGTTPD
ncbi:hypothetical protein [Saccharopolyspora gregorii]|uniref:Meckel syndrome type 1 protein n=1 Tax=Saccharopolyspora gregorii TaxID=33914 RepID=A0ABP6S016_9PSEU